MFPIVVDSYRSGSIRKVDYAGYLLSCVGQQLQLPIAPDIKRKLAEALYALHANDVIHGDPRIENALLEDGDVKWIDFRDVDFVTTKISRKKDVEILFASLGGNVSGARDLITLYSNEPSVAILCAVIC